MRAFFVGAPIFQGEKTPGPVMARVSKISGRRRELFLDEVRKHGVIAVAARTIDCPRRMVYAKMQDDPDFRRAVEEAREESIEGMEREAIRRAVEGVPSYVVANGKILRRKGKEVIERKYSDQLLMFLMSCNSAKYRKQIKIKVDQAQSDGTLDGDIRMMRQALANMVAEGADLDSVGKVLKVIGQLELTKKQLEQDGSLGEGGVNVEVVFSDDPDDYDTA